MSIEQRFWKYVQPEPNTGCWLWAAHCDTQGYPRLWDGEKTVRAHRFSYEISKGSIPSGLVLDHLCRVKSCVNPDHLEAVTIIENCRRSPLFNGNKTHCKHGHILTDDYRFQGKRHCRQCRRRRNKEAYARKRAKMKSSTETNR